MIKIKLREVRLNKGLSQEELADLIGMSQCSYSRRENGKKSISDNEWYKIAKSLDVTKEVIYEINIAKINKNDFESQREFSKFHFILKYLEFLKKENTALKEKLKAFEINSK